MRLFDLIGAAAVVGWLALVSAYVWQTYFADNTVDFGGEVVLHEGQSWMLLTREGRDVGYIHETRTELDNDAGWLLEYDLLMNVQMLGINQFLKTNIKASVDPNAYLNQFNAKIAAASTEFVVEGTVEGSTVTMSTVIAGKPREQKIDLGQRPRLANSAVNELIASENLTPGQRFEQEYFDPTKMGMTSIVFEYVREHEVDVYEEKHQTYHFRQIVAGNELDVYVDKRGEVYIQEFPFRIIGARVPEELGQSRAQAMRRDFKERKKNGDTSGGVDLGVESALGMMQGTGGIASPRYRLGNLPADVTLDLDSRSQLVTQRSAETVVVDTSLQAQPEAAGLAEKEALLEGSLRVDIEAEVFTTMLKGSDAATPTLKAEELARQIQSRITAAPNVGIQTASQVLETGEGDCTEYSLAYVAALRANGVPARFVFGAKPSDGKMIPHQWVQYWNGGEFVDVDLTEKSMLPLSGQLQLFTGPEPEHPHYVAILDQIEIEPLADASKGAGTKSDFN